MTTDQDNMKCGKGIEKCESKLLTLTSCFGGQDPWTFCSPGNAFHQGEEAIADIFKVNSLLRISWIFITFSL